MSGQYLRTNWRVTPEALQPQAIAGLVAKGSGQNSIGLYSPNGDVMPNLVIFSWSADCGDGNGFITINACSMLSAAFGASAVSMFPYGTSGVGFKILPIGIMTRRIHAYTAMDGATSGSQGGIWFSITASDDSGVNFKVRVQGSQSTCSASWHAVITAFIVSTP